MQRAVERGQATVEAALLWLTIAVIVGALAALLAGSAAPGTIVAALSGRPAPRLGPRAERAFAESLTGDGPTVLAAAALAQADLGPGAAGAVLRARLLAFLAARHGLEGELDVTRLVTPGPGLSLRALPAGPVVVAGIATSQDEPAPGGTDLGDAAAFAPDGSSAILASAGRPLERPAHLLGRVATAFDVAGAILVRLHAQQPGPAPGEQAGDVLYCRPYRAYWFRGRLRAFDRPMGDLWRVAVLRGGRLLADRVVTSRAC